jgi:hypothetical protein
MKVTTTVSLDEATLERAKAFAAAEKRSFSNLLEVWIEQKLSQQSQDERSEPEEAAA